MQQSIVERGGLEPTLVINSSAPGEWVFLGFGARGQSVPLRWRLRDHWVELVLAKARVSRDSLERALSDHPLPGAAIADRGQTEYVVWVPTPEIDLAVPLEGQAGAFSEALLTASGLAGWYIAVRGSLDAVP